MNRQEAQEIFDGCLLGDGSLYRRRNGARFSIALSKVTPQVTMEDNYNWLKYIKNECLIPLGVDVSNIYPKYAVKRRTSGKHIGGPHHYVYLTSHQSPYLTEQYDRWYSWVGEWIVQKGYEHQSNNYYRKDDTKIVPENLVFTPKILANWFKGDGRCNRDTHQYNTIKTNFCTNGFTEGEVYHLMGMLYDMGIVTNKPDNNGRNLIRGADLVIQLAQESVNHLFNLISPYMSSHRGMIQYKDGVSHKAKEETAREFEDLRTKLRNLRK